MTRTSGTFIRVLRILLRGAEVRINFAKKVSFCEGRGTNKNCKYFRLTDLFFLGSMQVGMALQFHIQMC